MFAFWQKFERNVVHRLFLLLLLLLLTACGGTNLNPNPNPDPDGDGLVSTSQIGILLLLEGYVKVEAPEIPVEIPQVEVKATYAFANFQAFPKNQDLPLDPLSQVFDTCFVSDVSAAALTAQQTLPELPELPELPTLPIGEGLTPISAGSELSMNTGSSLYTKLLQQENGYYISETMPDEAPQDLKVSIPGSDFPAFEAVALPQNVAKFSLSSPADKLALTSETTFGWSTDSSKDTFVLLIGSGDSGSRFTCYAKDDGSFNFPSDTLMAEVGFTGKLEGLLAYATLVNIKIKACLFLCRGL